MANTKDRTENCEIKCSIEVEFGMPAIVGKKERDPIFVIGQI